MILHGQKEPILWQTRARTTCTYKIKSIEKFAGESYRLLHLYRTRELWWYGRGRLFSSFEGKESLILASSELHQKKACKEKTP